MSTINNSASFYEPSTEDGKGKLCLEDLCGDFVEACTIEACHVEECLDTKMSIEELNDSYTNTEENVISCRIPWEMDDPEFNDYWCRCDDNDEDIYEQEVSQR